MSKGLTDLELTLYNGNMQDVPTATPDELQRLYFDVDLIRVRGVGNQFQKTTADTYKSDREMTVCEMQAAQDKSRKAHEAARKQFLEKRAILVKSKVVLSKSLREAETRAPWDVGLGSLYCRAIGLLAPKKAHAQAVPPVGRQMPKGVSGPADSTAAQAPTPTSSDLAMVENLRMRMEDDARVMNSYGVEIHKKFALAVACFVFVLLGAPIALRFPRAGVGLTIGVSLFVFALYYICLIAGESIAKRGMMPAVVSMWMANVIFALLALWMLSKMGQEGSTARGGDMKEMFGAIRGYLRSKIGWKDRRVRRERVAA
jgi:lipopolysaccharide export system permease protein